MLKNSAANRTGKIQITTQSDVMQPLKKAIEDIENKKSSVTSKEGSLLPKIKYNGIIRSLNKKIPKT